MRTAALSLAVLLAACNGFPPGSDDDDDDGPAGLSCGDNHGDGNAVPSAAQPLALGTLSTGAVCTTAVGNQFYYWKAEGAFTAADRFTLDLELRDAAAGERVGCAVGSDGTWSDAGGMTVVDAAAPKARSAGEDPVPQGSAGAVYVLCYGTSPEGGSRLLALDVTLTRE